MHEHGSDDDELEESFLLFTKKSTIVVDDDVIELHEPVPTAAASSDDAAHDVQSRCPVLDYMFLRKDVHALEACTGLSDNRAR